MTFRVDSEVGRLRQVILHRPGGELSRLTPDNVQSLLFDGIPWAERAREEHDAFAQALRDRGVEVHYFAQLLAEVLEDPKAREWVLDRVISDDTVGPTLVPPLRTLGEQADSERLAEYLIGGILKSELAHLTANSLRWELMSRDDFLLTPLPNHLFQRDNSAWIYRGVSINPMAMAARLRESVHSSAIYKFHPMFAGQDFDIWYGGDDRSHQPATLEGGDMHVLRNGAVMIGLGDRRPGLRVEDLPRRPFRRCSVTKVSAFRLPRIRRQIPPGTSMALIEP